MLTTIYFAGLGVTVPASNDICKDTLCFPNCLCGTTKCRTYFMYSGRGFSLELTDLLVEFVPHICRSYMESGVVNV